MKRAEYKLWFRNGSRARTATSMGKAIQIARDAFGVGRIYRGAEYQSDEGMSVDLWIEKGNAAREMGMSADCVLTMREVL